MFFGENNGKDVIGHYQEYLEHETDNEGNPLYWIEKDSNAHIEIIDGKETPIDFYVFRSDRVNYSHYKGLNWMRICLEKIYELMCAVCSFPGRFSCNFRIAQDEIIWALEKELRQYAIEIGSKVERELKQVAQRLKPSRNASLSPEIWGDVMQEEDDLFDLAIRGKLVDNKEKRFDGIIEEERKTQTANYPLLQKIKSASLDDELFDIRLAVETHNLLSALNADNLDLFYNLILRRNIIHREMYPEKLRAAYDEWLKESDEKDFVDQGADEDKGNGLSKARQSKLDEIIGYMEKGNWKHPATADNIKQLLNTVFGRDQSLLEDGDKALCEKMWSLVERGRSNRIVIVSANLAGYFAEENLLDGTPKEISNALFGSKENQVNNINKGKSGNCSQAFTEIIGFLKKYIGKIIRSN